MSAARSGWSPSTISAARRVAVDCSEPDRQRARQAARRDRGSGRAARLASRSAGSIASASSPRTTTTRQALAASTASSTCCRTGRPAELGQQLHAAEPRRRPGREDDRADHAARPLGHPPVIGVGSRTRRIRGASRSDAVHASGVRCRRSARRRSRRGSRARSPKGCALRGRGRSGRAARPARHR